MEIVAGLARWLHFFFGVMWIGLLYYFNFVQGCGHERATPTHGRRDHEARAAARALVLPLGRRPDVDHGRNSARYARGGTGFVKAFTFQAPFVGIGIARGSARSC